MEDTTGGIVKIFEAGLAHSEATAKARERLAYAWAVHYYGEVLGFRLDDLRAEIDKIAAWRVNEETRRNSYGSV